MEDFTGVSNNNFEIANSETALQTTMFQNDTSGLVLFKEGEEDMGRREKETAGK